MEIEQIVPKRQHIKLRRHTTYEDGTDCSETSTHKIQTPHDLWMWNRLFRNVGT